jgi:hypothetical protein
LDYPVEKAQKASATYRATFDANTLKYRFDGLDAKGFFNYTLYGTRAGQPVKHRVTVIYGDSLVGLRDEFVPEL